MLTDYLNQYRNLFQFLELNPDEEQQLIAQIKAFGTYQHYDMVVLRESVWVICPNHRFILAVISLSIDHITTKTRQYNGTEVLQEVLGFTRLRFDQGRLLIRPESLQDKLIEYFVQAEVDYKEFPLFSKKYYLLTDQPDRKLPSSMLSTIEKYDDLEIEVMGNTLQVGHKRIYTEENAALLLKFLSELGGG
ncbi:MAG: hypothetical protein IPH45_21220 [Bacteroidales bacterium]|nr:hypothetical protein [Bacteroidales bacterium]